MKKCFLIYKLIIFAFVLMQTNSCKKEEENKVPTLTTTEATAITTTTATSGGNITNDGGAAIAERGICYSNSQNPTTANSKIIETGTTGSFSSNISGLTAGATYYVRAYAVNSVGIAYGNEINFTTTPLFLPTLTTTEVTAITTTTAISGGNITNDGGAAITERGICYSNSQNPTTANFKIIETGTTGSFSSNISGLTTGATYYVRAYAINSVGTAYGNEINFTTFALVDIDNNYYNSIIIGSQTWMKENLKTTKYRDGSTIANITDNTAWSTQTEGAYCWYENNITNKNKYGALYNWYTVTDIRNLCPAGWHIPSDTEWKALEVYLGMSQAQIDDIYWRGTDQGDQMKSTNGWNNNGNGNNSSGFTALPSGFRGGNIYGPFLDLGNSCAFWCSTEFDASNSWYRFLHEQYGSGGVYRNYVDKKNGQSVRCLKDN